MSRKEHIRLIHKDWFSNPTMLYFWVNLLFEADEEGLVVTSLSSLATSLRLSIQQVRTCLANIECNKLITRRATNEGTEITICDIDSYKCNQQAEQQTNQHAINTPSNTREKESAPVPPNGLPSNSLSFTPYNPPKEKNEEGDTDVSPKKRDKPVSGPSDFSFVLELWNSYAKRNVPKIKAITPARRDKVKLRIAEMGGVEKAKEILAECFKKISESDFATGATGKWAANFDWFFSNEKNWLKVLEGNYDNRKEKSQLEVLAENIAKADAYYEQRYHGYGGASPYGNQTGSGADGPDEQ